MRSIAVNGRFLSQSTTGVQRYAFELLSALDSLLSAGKLQEVPVTIYVPRNAEDVPEFSFLQVKEAGRLTGQAWEQLDLRRHAAGSLLFTPCGGMPIAHRPHVITIHDATPFAAPHAFSRLYGVYYRRLFQHAARTAAHIITVSEFSRQELVRYLGISPSRITCTHLSGEHVLRSPEDPCVLQRYGLEKGKYLLGVSSRNPIKNFPNLIGACRLLLDANIKVAIAGGANSAVFGEVPLSSESFTGLGFVSDTELRNLYQHAACFVFPSFYEGFGLPPLEAITLGCPVVVARAASLPEVLKEAAIYCDPNSPQDIARQISRVLQGEHLSREAMMAHASKFTWERCAIETWSILLRAMSATRVYGDILRQ